jgi:HEAT repeat protein
LRRVKHFFLTLDEYLASYGRVFGVGIVNPILRHALFLTVYGVIYGLTIFGPPMVGFVALWIGYIGVLAVGRAWAQNESTRAKIAKKIEDLNPDNLPDLRITAALAAVQMILLVPMLLQTSHALFDLFDMPNNATWKTWALFALDLLFRSFLDWSEVYEVHISGVGLNATGGRHLVMFILLSIDYMIVQTVIRIVGINQTIQEGVSVAGKDPEVAFRLGQRATPRLAEMASDDEIEIEARIRVIEALGMIGDNRGANALVELLANQQLHTSATASLVLIGHFDSLIAGIRHENPLVRRGCVTALGRLEDSIANEILAEAINDKDPGVRKYAHQAIGRSAHPSDIPLLQFGLNDEDIEVRYSALKQFSNFTSDRAMAAVLIAVEDKSASIRRLAVEILARFPNPAVVPALAKAMQDEDSEVASAAKRSIEHLESLVKGGAA